MKILHLFNWKLLDIIPELELIASQGFNAIQINPIQPSKDEECNKWWMCYQPIDFTIGNKYGSKKDLIYLCNVAKFYKIDIIADVVINHIMRTKRKRMSLIDYVDTNIIKLTKLPTMSM